MSQRKIKFETCSCGQRFIIFAFVANLKSRYVCFVRQLEWRVGGRKSCLYKCKVIAKEAPTELLATDKAPLQYQGPSASKRVRLLSRSSSIRVPNSLPLDVEAILTEGSLVPRTDQGSICCKSTKCVPHQVPYPSFYWLLWVRQLPSLSASGCTSPTACFS